jgi:hypothetical protein
LAASTKVIGTCSVSRPVREISEEGVPSSDQNFLYHVTVVGGGLGGKGTDGSRTGDGDEEGVVILLGERTSVVLAGRGVGKDRVLRGKARAMRSLFRSACRLAAYEVAWLVSTKRWTRWVESASSSRNRRAFLRARSVRDGLLRLHKEVFGLSSRATLYNSRQQ